MRIESRPFVAVVQKLVGRWWPKAEGQAPLTVLIVDDEAPIARFVQRVLREAGCRTFVARDGAEAVSLAASIDGLDVLVTDLMMPVMNGDELARRLRVTAPDLPVLYLTAFSDKLFAERMQLWANEAFLDKPCSVKGLLEAVSLVSRRPLARTFNTSAVARVA